MTHVCLFFLNSLMKGAIRKERKLILFDTIQRKRVATNPPLLSCPFQPKLFLSGGSDKHTSRPARLWARRSRSLETQTTFSRAPPPFSGCGRGKVVAAAAW
jgi:hypothetical protein